MQGVYQSGSEQHPAIVLLHSSLSSARQWRELVTRLEPDYRVINLDLYGYGQGPAVEDPGTFGLATEARRVTDILEQLKVEKYHLLGHSYGGALALKLALEQNLRIRSLILFEPVAFHLLSKDEPGYQEIVALASGMPDDQPRQAAAAFVDYWNGAGYFAGLPEPMQALFTRQVDKVRLDFQALLSEPYAPYNYAKIKQPTLLMTGKHSRQSAHAVAAIIGHRLPGLTARPVSGGHMAPISHTKLVNEQILTFLAGSD
jgi:pimeloyl-ACP methyl ester carboxylesterase